MIPRHTGRLLAAVLALAVSGALFVVSTEAYRGSLGLALAPFGRFRVVVVHLLAALPFAHDELRDRFNITHGRLSRGVFAIGPGSYPS